jgi:hypothetical protein
VEEVGSEISLTGECEEKLVGCSERELVGQ